MTAAKKTSLTIAEVPVRDLRAYGKNPRLGNVEKIAESLRVNGQYRPIVVRRETGEILAGNHTWKAAKSLGWETVQATYVDGLDDEAAARIVLADNKTSDLGTYSSELLAELLVSLDTLDGTGYGSDELEQLVAEVTDNKDIALTDPDHVPALPSTTLTITKPGDVWLLGKHRVVCGSATNPDDYKLLMAGKEADLVVTDPPYNVNYEGRTKEQLTIENDNMTEEHFEKFLDESFAAMYENTRAGGPIYVFHPDVGDGVFRRTYARSGFLLKQVLIWVKDRFVMGRQDHHWQHEPILYGWKPGAAHYWYGARTDTTVFDEQPKFADMNREALLEHLAELYEATTIIREPRPGRNADHPTMKPVALVTRLINHSSAEGGIVLDPFGGSGSTLIAAHGTGRKARIIELDPRYVDLICRRYEEHTGVTPIRATTGEPVTFAKEVDE